MFTQILPTYTIQSSNLFYIPNVDNAYCFCCNKKNANVQKRWNTYDCFAKACSYMYFVCLSPFFFVQFVLVSLQNDLPCSFVPTMIIPTLIKSKCPCFCTSHLWRANLFFFGTRCRVQRNKYNNWEEMMSLISMRVVFLVYARFRWKGIILMITFLYVA